MAARTRSATSLVAEYDQPLYALIFEEDGREVVRYFVDDEAADAAVAEHRRTDARALAGAWSHLDWEEMIDELDRIRHESRPTPPIDDL